MSKDGAMSERIAPWLVVMRHAKAQSTAASDRERRLTDRGESDARAAGEWLVASGWAPELLLVSSAVRARQTADLVAAAPGTAPEVVVIDDLYDADGPEVLRICAERVGADVGCAAVVGHNPTMVEVAMLLLESDDHEVRLRPGSLAILELRQSWEQLDAGGARLADRFSPRGD
jgi:phosphohistidine phosphatase